MKQHKGPGDSTRVEGRSRAEVMERIRRAIVEGEYAAGSQLPTFDALVDRYGLSRATMQLVMKELKVEGFVRSVHRSGLYVVERPPHLHRFGLAFSDAPGHRNWNRFMAALLAESRVVAEKQPGVEFVPYFGVRPSGRSEGLDRLRKESAQQRLAGVMVTDGTEFLLQESDLRESGVPCVGINQLPTVEQGSAPVVNTDDRLFLERALGWLAEQGRKRVGLLAMRPLVRVREPDRVSVADCERAGLKTRPHWLCPVSNAFSGQVRSVVHLLLDYPPKERPDALVIATDNLVEEALAAILELDLRIGRDLDVVTHCNWPWPVESPLPIARLGFHSHQFLERGLEAICAIRRGESPVPMTLVPALFEHEL